MREPLMKSQEQNAVLRIKFFFGSFFFQEKGTKAEENIYVEL